MPIPKDMKVCTWEQFDFSCHKQNATLSLISWAERRFFKALIL